jgi:hypothetical protein
MVPRAGVRERAARRAEVRPGRIEPQRAEIAAPLPPAIIDAMAAHAADQQPLSELQPEPLRVHVPENDSGDSDFDFFGRKP